MVLRVTILGCGSSGGVPRPASGWGACDPTNPRNRRRRCSILVERVGRHGVTRVLIDTGPDLREQLISAAVDHLDAVLLTHEHADHTHGIDDLRPVVLHTGRVMNVHMDPVTAALMRDRFRYIFESLPGSSYPPIAIAHEMQPPRPVTIEGQGGPLTFTPFLLEHGDIQALGLRVDDLVYMPDVNTVPDAARGFLDGLDVLIIDALRHRRHPAHFSVAEALEWIARVTPREAVLTNLHTDLDYATLCAALPAAVRPAHDGLVIEVAAGLVSMR
jgi:phosphoribosyl 1,2-cyclic phosphate phosphodiesterase